MRSVDPGDDQARFLADLRALRDTAAIGFEELAARAHYPSDLLKEAENGPRLPSLPILTAYVRACEGNVPEWEERWRRLGDETRADPNLPVRPAGASPAAMAGARAGIGVAPPEAYDPDRIKAALRGGASRPADGPRPADGLGSSSGLANGLGNSSGLANELGNSGLGDGLGTSSGPGDGLGTSSGLGDGWGASDVGAGPETSDVGVGRGAGAGWKAAADSGAGGGHRAEGWAAADAERAQAARDDQFSASWDREPASRAGNATFPWLEQTPRTPPAPKASQVSPSSASAQIPHASATAQVPHASATPQVPQASVAAQVPQASPSSSALATPQVPQIPQATWTLGGALAAEPGGGGPARAGVDQAQGSATTSVGAVQPRSSGGSARPAGAAAALPRRQRNRVFTWQLVVLVIVAALLGSVLMMILR